MTNGQTWPLECSTTGSVCQNPELHSVVPVQQDTTVSRTTRRVELVLLQNRSGGVEARVLSVLLINKSLLLQFAPVSVEGTCFRSQFTRCELLLQIQFVFAEAAGVRSNLCEVSPATVDR